MTKNPFANATFAALYIVLIVNLMNVVIRTTEEGSGESILVPMAVLSLFVLSAAIMGFLFISEPIKMYLDGKKQEAVNFFLKTIASFAVFVALFVGIAYYTMLSA